MPKSKDRLRFLIWVNVINETDWMINMYQALYRKWRPKLFSDVIGQPHITKTLQNEISSNRIGHAYLFIGSRGTGKTTCAKIFAKAVNCLEPKDGNPCEKCEICSDIENSNLMDIVELDAASNNGVNDIRSICDSAAFTPAKAKYRVYIIDEVHMLSAGAFNALLKTLEEPPAHVIFILATTEAHKVPATILSRCQKFEFHKISAEEIAKRLDFIAEQENIKLEPQAGNLIAHISDGAMRDALTILDKCIGDDKAVTLEKVEKTVGMASREYLLEICEAIFQNKADVALDIVDKLNKESKDMVRLCEELIGFFRNIMLVKSMKEPRDLVNVSDEEFKKICELSEKIELSRVIDIMDTLESSLERMTKVCSFKIEFEMCLVRLCSSELNVSKESIINRLEKLEKLITSKNINSVKEEKSKPVKQISDQMKTIGVEKALSQNKNASTKADELLGLNKQENSEMEEIQRNAQKMTNWQEVLDVLKGYSQTIAMAFKDSTAYISGQFVLIDAPKEMAFELLRKSSQRDKLRLAIKQVSGKSYKLGPYKVGKKETKEDPLKTLVRLAKNEGVNVTAEGLDENFSHKN